MKVLFCHDGPLKIDEEGNYYGSAHNNETFKRYYTIGDELTALIRVNNIRKVGALNKYSKISIKPFDVIKCPSISSPVDYLKNKYKLKKIITKAVQETNYVVARIPSTIGYLAIDQAKKQNKPYLIELVTCPWDSYWNHSIKGKLVAPLMYFNARKYVKNASYVLYVTKDFLQNRYPTKGKSINCSNVSLPQIENEVFEKRLKKIDSMHLNKKVIIGTAGSVNVKFKGQQYIIETLGKMKSENRLMNLEYQLVGSGDQKYLKNVAIKNNVEDNVVFLGAIPHAQVFSWLDDIDIYIQPSKQEGLPRAVIEAMSHGVPSIGANTAGIPELLDKKFIFNHSRNSFIEISEKIENLLLNHMKNQANRNFIESKKYKKEIIEERRKNFFIDFKNRNEKKNEYK